MEAASSDILETMSTEADVASEPERSISRHLAERVRELRSARKWSLDTLSAVCGVSRSMLSAIERNETNPTLAVTESIARAFRLSIGDLVQAPGLASAMNVIRVRDKTFHYRSDADCRIRTLSPLNLEKDVEFYEVRLKARGALRSAAHFQGTREFLTVERGRVRVESGNDSEELGEGDSVSYHADVAHAIVNIGRGEAVVFLVDIYRNG
jgi:transcriptional regulator with XRE-family HTH domain